MATEQAEPHKYTAWLTPAQTRPIDGVSHDEVPTTPLPRDVDEPPHSAHWAWKVQRIPRMTGALGGSWSMSGTAATPATTNAYPSTPKPT
ncbi:hypothetical protein GCM10018780_81870 [Streptomyces lanatus]|nr:hypothetical protein GCM10018780_81870 [Streptomyces lanatus]